MDKKKWLWLIAIIIFISSIGTLRGLPGNFGNNVTWALLTFEVLLMGLIINKIHPLQRKQKALIYVLVIALIYMTIGNSIIQFRGVSQDKIDSNNYLYTVAMTNILNANVRILTIKPAHRNISYDLNGSNVRVGMKVNAPEDVPRLMLVFYRVGIFPFLSVNQTRIIEVD